VIGILYVGLKKQDFFGIVDTMITHASWAVSVMVLLISSTIVYFVRRQLLQLLQLEATMCRLQQEDISVIVPAQERGDEIGRMAKAVQRFKEFIIEKKRLHEQEELQKNEIEKRHAEMLQTADEFETTIDGIADVVAAAALSVRESVRSLTDIAEGTSGRAEAVGASAQEAYANVQTVAGATEEMNSSIGEVNRQIHESTDIANLCVEQAQGTKKVIQDLAHAADNIGHIVKLIEDIAGQVNLLALNATIEAARAG
jgi:methyl-accepting chemotaxis protein